MCAEGSLIVIRVVETETTAREYHVIMKTVAAKCKLLSAHHRMHVRYLCNNRHSSVCLSDC